MVRPGGPLQGRPACKTGSRASGRDCVFEFGLDLDCGEARGIPATSQRLDEEYTGDQALPLNHSGLLFIVQEVLLRGNDIQIAHQSASVAILGKIERAARGVQSELLSLARLLKHRESG